MRASFHKGYSVGLLGDLSAWLDNKKRVGAATLTDPEMGGLLSARFSGINSDMRGNLQAMGDAVHGSVMPEINAGLLGRGIESAMSVGTLMGMGRAKAGGETGLNNAFYQGGQFLPSSAATEKGKMQFPKSMRAGNKAEIEPGVYAPRPEDGMLPFKGQIADVVDWRAYRDSGAVKPFNNPQYFDYLSKQTGKSADELAKDAHEALDAYRRGARWIKDGVPYDANGQPLP